MTVKDAIKVLKTAKSIDLCYGSDIIPFEMSNPISLHAFGGYVVDDIKGMGDDSYEVSIAMIPVKEGA